MREQHGYTRFALHGESIGGLVRVIVAAFPGYHRCIGSALLTMCTCIVTFLGGLLCSERRSSCGIPSRRQNIFVVADGWAAFNWFVLRRHVRPVAPLSGSLPTQYASLHFSPAVPVCAAAGNWTSALVRYIVCWPENNVRPFIDARCYKVVANDTNDDIIHDSASLRTGIAEWSVRGLHVRKRKKQARASAAIATELANDPSVSKGTADQVVVDMAAVETHPAHLGASRGHDEADDDDDGGGDDGDAHLPLMPGTGSRVPSASATSGSNTNGSVDDSVVLSETAAENILSGGSLAVEKFRDMAERMLELAGTCDAVTTSQASGSEEGPGASALKGWYAAIERLTARAILVFSSQKVVAAMQARRGQVRTCACVFTFSVRRLGVSTPRQSCYAFVQPS